MFKTLRSRLLLAFTAVIATVLAILAVFLLAFSTVPRSLSMERNVEQLLRANRSVRYEITEWRRDPSSGEELEQTLTRIADQQDTRVLLVNGNNIIFDSNDEIEGRRFNPQVVPERQLGNVNVSSDISINRFRASEETTWLVLSQNLQLRQNRVLVVIGVPEPRPFDTFRDVFLWPLIQAACASLLLAALLAFWITRSIARPLGKLADAAGAIASGNYDQRVEPQGPREVRLVATSFNSMAQQVKQTQQAQRDFVANVSHDLKTPITSIQGWSQALIDGAAQNPTQQEKAATIIHTESARMGRLVNQLLDVAKLESGQFNLQKDYVNINRLLNRLTEQVKQTVEAKQLTLTADLPEQPLFCYGDPDRLMQIFSNLLENGLKYTAAGGHIHIQLQESVEQTMQISFQDSGIGIPAEDLDRIFERFYQVDKSRTRQGKNGTKQSIGLGLAIVKQLVEAHGGRASAKSTVGTGSTFIVHLPIAQPLKI